MLLSGRYTRNSEYFIQIISNAKTQRWTLYSPVALDDLQNFQNSLPLKYPVITQDAMTYMGGRLETLNPYVVVSGIITHSGKLMFYYGNTTLLSTLMSELTAAEEMKGISEFLQITMSPDLDDSSIIRAWVLPSGGKLEFISRNMFFRTAAPIKGLAYYDAKIFSDAALDKSVRLTKLRTWKQLRADKGTALSWLYDEQGNEIKDYRLILTDEELDWVCSELSKPDYVIVAWDTESTGLNIFYMGDVPEKRDKICGMSLTWKADQGIYIPFMSEKFKFWDTKLVLDRLVPILQTKVMAAHNGLFDMRVLKSLGYILKTKIDTMLMEFLFDSHVSKGSKGLKLVTRKYFGHETLELDDVLGGSVDANLIPYLDADVIRVYGCSDTDYVWKLVQRNLGKISKSAQKPFSLDNSISSILANAEYYGARIDQNLLHVLAEVNHRDLKALTEIMQQYLRDIGTKTLAKRKLTQMYEDSGTPLPVSEEHIQAVASNADFLESIESAFRKDTKVLKPLEFSSPADVVKILYYILEYPITRRDRDTGKAKADSEALEDLMSYKAEMPIKFLSKDVISSIVNTNLHPSRKESIVVELDQFEGMQFPFAYLLTKWRGLNKLETSFFTPLIAKEKGEFYYTTNSMTSAETARVINPIQTLIGQLKKLVLPFSSEYYFIVFDMAQIEFRDMIGLAINYWNGLIADETDPDALSMLRSRDITPLAKKLALKETDYHREGGAVFINTTPEDMTKDERSDVKAVHFSVPFGAGVFSIAKEALRKARTEYQRQQAIDKTSKMLGAWQKNMYPLYYFLERVRDIALQPVPQSELPYGKTGKWGRATNAFGRYRWFDLNDIGWKQQNSIRRMAGNFPIQSFAREIFFTIVKRIHDRLIREGYIVETDEVARVVMSLFIHDETVMCVHRSINPYVMYKIIYEECMAIKLKGHPPYYMGLAVVNNWYEGKSDAYEAPVEYVEQMIAKLDANPEEFKSQSMFGINARNYVYKGIRDYMTARYLDALKDFLTETPDRVDVDMDSFLPGFKNYFLKPRLEVHYSKHHSKEYPIPSPKSDDWANIVGHYEEVLILSYPNKPAYIHFRDEVYLITDRWAEGEKEKVLTEIDITMQDEEVPAFIKSNPVTHETKAQSKAQSKASPTSAFGDVFNSSDSDMFAGGEPMSGEELIASLDISEDSDCQSIFRGTLDSEADSEDDFGIEAETMDASLDDYFSLLDDLGSETDFQEDESDREASIAAEAAILLEEERSVFIDTDLKFVEDMYKEDVRIKTRMLDLGQDRVVIDVTGIDTPTFNKLRPYLMNNKDAVGRELFFLQGSRMVPSGIKINYLVSREQVDAYLEPATTNPTSTS